MRAKRIGENIDVFDFKLTPEEVAAIDKGVRSGTQKRPASRYSTFENRIEHERLPATRPCARGSAPAFRRWAFLGWPRCLPSLTRSRTCRATTGCFEVEGPTSSPYQTPKSPVSTA